MSATDIFSWLPDMTGGIAMKYKFDTIINRSETGNDISRVPLYDKPKRTQSLKMFSFADKYLSAIENFLRYKYADFFQVPVFSEPITPIPGNGKTWGDSLKNVTTISTDAGLNSLFNLVNLTTNILMIDATNQNNAELHTFVSNTDTSLTIGGAFTNNFYLGKTVYYPVFQSYNNGFSDSIVTPALEDTSLIFEEYF